MEERKEPASKTYRVRVPLYLSKLLDEKLKEDKLQYSTMAREAIEKYLRKPKKK